MSVRVLHDQAQGHAALYDSVTGVALPIQIFSDWNELGLFLGAEDIAERFAHDAEAAFEKDVRRIEIIALRTFQTDWLRENMPGSDDWSARHAAG